MNEDLTTKLSILPDNVLDHNNIKLEMLQEMASAQNIPLHKIMPRIQAGRVGKQKDGLLQVLRE
jgi:hypothetical protein